MNVNEFRQYAHQLVDWIAQYYEEIEQYPVKSPVLPREIYNSISDEIPIKGELFELIFKDFEEKILKGITHWQHPSFFAYFPANSSFPSLLGEFLTAALGAQCMIWDTSPAAAELEEKVMNWLKKMMGLPDYMEGVIQDTASSATLCAILTAREKCTDFRINAEGFAHSPTFRVYCSSQTHSSIDKAVKIAGLGKENLIKIPTDEKFALIPLELEKAILADIARGFQPLCVVATIGTTSSTAIDPLKAIGEICQRYQIFLHVDAAYAGTATILPEKRNLIEGIEFADTYVFNPHKWMMTNFDCTAYFVKDKAALIRTFEILPEYLKTQHDQAVHNYRDWGIQLGRRFRALKLWFVIRSFGVEGIQQTIRHHLALAQLFAQKTTEHPDFELVTEVSLNLVCFRYKPASVQDNEQLNELNATLIAQLNQSGKAYLTHTKLNDIYTLRAVFGQTHVSETQVESLWDLLINTIKNL